MWLLKQWICAILGLSAIAFAVLGFIYVKSVFISDAKYFTKEILVPIREKRISCQQMCMTKDCVLSSAILLHSVDFNGADPCTDFHLYSCGNHPPVIPNDSDEVEDLNQLRYLMDIKNMLQRISDEDVKPLRQLKKFYDHCVSYKTYDELAISGLLNTLSDAGLSGWPHLPENWSFQTRDGNMVSLDFVLYKLAVLNSKSIVYINYNSNASLATSSDRIGIDIDIDISPNIPLKKAHLNFLKYSNVLNKRKNLIQDLFQYLNIDIEKSKQYADEIMQFQGMLHNVSEQNTTEIKDRQSLSNSEWNMLITLLLENSGIPLNSSDIFVTSRTKTLRKFLLQQPPKTIGNYLAYRFIFNYLGNLGFFFRNMFRSQIYLMDTLGQGVGNAKWQECAMRSVVHFERIIVYMTLEKQITINAMKELDNVYFRLHDSTLSVLDNITWLNSTRKDKIKTFISSIPSPSKEYEAYSSKTFLKNVYNNLDMQKASYFENNMEFITFHQHFYIKEQIMKETESFLNLNRLAYAGAFAMKEKSQIKVGMPFLRFPFLSFKRPNPFNIANLGFILGHEISHFVEEFFKSDILSEDDKPEAYKNYETCVVDFYSSYKYEHYNETLNGISAFSENAADLIGTEIAYQAFKQAVTDYEKNGMKFGILGMNLTSDQLFFLLFAQYYCKPTTKETELMMIIMDDGHSPNKFRILGTASNINAFGNAYKCSINSPMNPEKKCTFIH